MVGCMNNSKPAVLLVESRRSTFTEHVLARTDIEVGLLCISSESELQEALQSRGVPCFRLDMAARLEDEAERFGNWSRQCGFRPTYFCNPNEALQSVAQAFADLLGLPALSEWQVAVVRNKIAMKTFYRQHGIPCAEHAKVDSTSDIGEFASRHGFPLIVKPTDSDSCIETYRINAMEEMCTLHEHLSWMVESYIEGEEYQICAIVADGRVLDAYIASNPAPIIEVFEGAINANITLAPSERKPIDPVVLMQKIATALSLKCGYLHGEFFMKKNGEFVMSEVAARLSGCEVPLNHSLAYGFDFLNAIMDTYVGRIPQLVYTQDRAVGDLLLPAEAGVIRAISSERELMAMPGVIACKLNYEIGQLVVPKRSSGFCAGYVQVEGRDSGEVASRMHDILARFSLEMEEKSLARPCDIRPTVLAQ